MPHGSARSIPTWRLFADYPHRVIDGHGDSPHIPRHDSAPTAPPPLDKNKSNPVGVRLLTYQAAVRALPNMGSPYVGVSILYR